eukprot:g1850.t1
MYDVKKLKKATVFFHFVAATGLDEALPFSFFTAYRPYFLRRLQRGSPTAPLFSFLPNETTFVGVAAYAGWMLLSVQIVLEEDDYTVDTYLAYWVAMFLLLSVLDMALFLSSRPGDILKYAGVLLFSSGLSRIGWYLVAWLYIASGLGKFRAHFWAWVFPYFFLLPSPISYWLKHYYLDSTSLAPTLATKVFGFFGSAQEAAVGVLMIVGAIVESETIELFAVCLASAMHLFIFTMGVGPYRWNVYQVFLCWCCYVSRRGHDEDGTRPWNILEFLYVTVLGVVVPACGFIDPQFVGKYLGGFRMAQFHFAGNETKIAFFVRRACLSNFAKRAKKSSDNDYDVTIRGIRNALTRRWEERKEDELDAKPCPVRCQKQYRLFLLNTEGYALFSSKDGALYGAGGGSDLKSRLGQDWESRYLFVDLLWLNQFGSGRRKRVRRLLPESSANIYDGKNGNTKDKIIEVTHVTETASTFRKMLIKKGAISCRGELSRKPARKQQKSVCQKCTSSSSSLSITRETSSSRLRRREEIRKREEWLKNTKRYAFETKMKRDRQKKWPRRTLGFEPGYDPQSNTTFAAAEESTLLVLAEKEVDDIRKLWTMCLSEGDDDDDGDDPGEQDKPVIMCPASIKKQRRAEAAARRRGLKTPRRRNSKRKLNKTCGKILKSHNEEGSYWHKKDATPTPNKGNERPQCRKLRRRRKKTVASQRAARY